MFFFNDTATTEIYTLSLHDALPISTRRLRKSRAAIAARWPTSDSARAVATKHACAPRKAAGSSSKTSSSARRACRSEEHTSELQSRQYLVCRLLLEKKKNTIHYTRT